MRATSHLRGGLIVVLAFAAGLATFAATGFGRGEHSRATVHAAGGVVGRMAASTSGVKLTYLSTTGTVAGGTFSGAKGTCPRSTPHPISAFFDSGSDKVVLGAARPDPPTRESSRTWLVGVSNLGDSSTRYEVGLVCAK
jgi:hypothetical protein